MIATIDGAVLGFKHTVASWQCREQCRVCMYMYIHIYNILSWKILCMFLKAKVERNNLFIRVLILLEYD